METSRFLKTNFFGLLLISLVAFFCFTPVGNVDAKELQYGLSERIHDESGKKNFEFSGFIGTNAKATTAVFTYVGSSHQFYVPIIRIKLSIQVKIWSHKFWITDFDVSQNKIQISDKPSE